MICLKGNYNEETLNTVAPNSEMYFPTDQNMIITNQVNSSFYHL